MRRKDHKKVLERTAAKRKSALDRAVIRPSTGTSLVFPDLAVSFSAMAGVTRRGDKTGRRTDGAQPLGEHRPPAGTGAVAPRRVEMHGKMVRCTARHKQLNIDRWAIDNRINVAMAIDAQMIAAYSDPLYDFITQLRSDQLKRQLPELPDAILWRRFYRRHRELWRVIGNKASGRKLGDELVKTHSQVRIMLREREAIKAEIAKMDPKKLQRDLNKIFRAGLREYHKHLLELRAIFAEKTSQLRADLEKQLRRIPEMHFFLTVALPCVAMFGTSPGHLLRLARKVGRNPIDDPAHVEALENLVRLDPCILEDKRIAAWWHGGSGAVRQGRSEMVAQWMRDGVKGMMSRKSCKQMLGGLISYMAEGLAIRWTASGAVEKYKLTAPQIMSLFDAAAKDHDKADLTGKDPDLRECSPEAWAKAIERNRKELKAGLDLSSDKKGRK